MGVGWLRTGADFADATDASVPTEMGSVWVWRIKKNEPKQLF